MAPEVRSASTRPTRRHLTHQNRPPSSLLQVARREPITNRTAVDAYGLGCILLDVMHVHTGVGGADGAEGRRLRRAERAAGRVTPIAPGLRRALLDYEPSVSPRLPVPLASLLLSLLAVDPALRPSADAARVRLAAMSADSVDWAWGIAAAAAAAAPPSYVVALQRWRSEGGGAGDGMADAAAADVGLEEGVSACARD